MRLSHGAKAARSPPTVVSASKLAPPPATAPPPPKRELSTRSYVIGGLNFEVDSRYKIKSIVGKGAYGLVCAAEDLCPAPEDLNSPKQADPAATTTATPPAADDKKAPAMVAVKKVIDPFHDHTDCKRLLREIRLLRCLRHPNVLHLTDIMPAKSPSPTTGRTSTSSPASSTPTCTASSILATRSPMRISSTSSGRSFAR